MQLKYSKKAVELQENNPMNVFNFAKLLLYKYGDLGQAAIYFEKAYRASPDNYGYASSYCYVLTLLGRFEDASEID